MRSSLRQPGRAWVAHRDRTDAGHELALGQMPVAHQALAAVIGELVGMATAQGGYFDLDRCASSARAPLLSTRSFQNQSRRVLKTGLLAQSQFVVLKARRLTRRASSRTMWAAPRPCGSMSLC